MKTKIFCMLATALVTTIAPTAVYADGAPTPIDIGDFYVGPANDGNPRDYIISVGPAPAGATDINFIIGNGPTSWVSVTPPAGTTTSSAGWTSYGGEGGDYSFTASWTPAAAAGGSFSVIVSDYNAFGPQPLTPADWTYDTPEPSALSLLGFGILSLLSRAWRRRKAKA